MTLGSQEDAELAQSFRHVENEFYIGSGATRSCYLINGVLYKITSYAQNYVNDTELDIYNSLDMARLPEWISIPRMTGYVVDDQSVLAAEFVPGTMLWVNDLCVCVKYNADNCNRDDCLGAYRFVVLKQLGFEDSGCYGNVVRHVDGPLYLVDLPE